MTSILAKIGIEGINSNLATAIRTVAVLIVEWGMVFITGAQNEYFSAKNYHYTTKTHVETVVLIEKK